MKLLRVITSVDPRSGGPVEGIRQISPLLAAQGHLAEVACLDDPASPWLADFPIPVHALGPARTPYAYSPRLIAWLKENAPRYDAVIVHGLWQYTGFAVWRTLRGSPVPYYVYPHGMLDPWFKRTYPLKHLKKSLYWPWGEYRVLRDAKAVLFTCEEEKLLARQSFRLYRANEVVVTYGITRPTGDTERQRAMFLARHPQLRDKRLLLFLSRIHPKKGCDLLIEAFARVAPLDPSLHLVMAGPDQTGWVSTLEEQAERLGVADRITWPGMLAGDMKWGAFFSSEAFVLPSHQENFGIAVVEALACGLPVLISDKVNIWREIADDQAGLVGADRLEPLTGLLQEWLQLPPASRLAMAQAARRCFEKRFDLSSGVERLLNVLCADLA
jgi:glycosyltransferase involved in cell wall biosynthesis